MKKGETVFITGAGRGLGFAIAEKFAKEGYDLVLNYRKPQGKSCANLLRFMKSDLANSVKVTLAQADISEPREIEKMVTNLNKDGVDEINHLVLNAASAPFKHFGDMTRNDWKLLLNSNLIGNVTCVNNIVPLMKKGGTICVISSCGSRRVLNKYPLGVMKAALEQLTSYLEIELYSKNIRVNSVCAGFLNTDVFPFLTELWPDLFQRYKDQPRRWLVEPEEIANIVSFLASEQSSAIRGTTIVADLGNMLEP